jgi:hypothetical protein
MVLCQRGETIASPVALVHVPTTKFHKCFSSIYRVYNVGIPQVLNFVLWFYLYVSLPRNYTSAFLDVWYEITQVLFWMYGVIFTGTLCEAIASPVALVHVPTLKFHNSSFHLVHCAM